MGPLRRTVSFDSGLDRVAKRDKDNLREARLNKMYELPDEGVTKYSDVDPLYSKTRNQFGYGTGADYRVLIDKGDEPSKTLHRYRLDRLYEYPLPDASVPLPYAIGPQYIPGSYDTHFDDVPVGDYGITAPGPVYRPDSRARDSQSAPPTRRRSTDMTPEMEVLNKRIYEYDVPGYVTEFTRSATFDRTPRFRRWDDNLPAGLATGDYNVTIADDDSDDDTMRVIRNRGRETTTTVEKKMRTVDDSDSDTEYKPLSRKTTEPRVSKHKVDLDTYTTPKRTKSKTYEYTIDAGFPGRDTSSTTYETTSYSTRSGLPRTEITTETSRVRKPFDTSLPKSRTTFDTDSEMSIIRSRGREPLGTSRSKPSSRSDVSSYTTYKSTTSYDDDTSEEMKTIRTRGREPSGVTSYSSRTTTSSYEPKSYSTTSYEPKSYTTRETTSYTRDTSSSYTPREPSTTYETKSSYSVDTDKYRPSKPDKDTDDLMRARIKPTSPDVTDYTVRSKTTTTSRSKSPDDDSQTSVSMSVSDADVSRRSRVKFTGGDESPVDAKTLDDDAEEPVVTKRAVLDDEMQEEPQEPLEVPTEDAPSAIVDKKPVDEEPIDEKVADVEEEAPAEKKITEVMEDEISPEVEAPVEEPVDVSLAKEKKPDEKVKEPKEKKPEEVKPAEKEPEEQKPAEKKPEEKKPADKKPETKKPEEKKPEEKKPEEPKPEEKKPEEKKPEKKPAQEEEVVKPIEEAPVEKTPEEENRDEILEEIVQIVNEARKKLPSGSFGVFKVEYTSGDDITMNFTIKPREFRKKTDDEIQIVIRNQILKQAEEKGWDLAYMMSIKMANEPAPEVIKTVERFPAGKPVEKKPEEKKPAPAVEEVIKPTEEAPVEKPVEKKTRREKACREET